ncbi:Kelch domain-containing protein 1 [Thelohanellus kitauei]|uniref:Kelch domain-containing protein 1 n=1 Tax=Thelohanellus kitauei TaxID=669202 RepID=A0A0C2MV02_THEKT|nr:Kelch domain-containing protein 1 [Thelohanellus kitauei]
MSQGGEQKRPENRAHHCMTSVCEFLIIYGGYENNTSEECNELWSYNAITGVWKWHKVPNEIKDTCISASICAAENIVYIFGGDCFDDDDYRQTNSLVSFDFTNATWDLMFTHNDDYDQNVPPPMCGNLLFYHNGSLYVLGGFHDSLNLETMYKFCIKTSTWSIVGQNGVKPTFNRQIFGTVYKNQIYCFEDPPNGSNKFREIRIFDFSTHTWTSRVTSSKNKLYPDDRIYESMAFFRKFGIMSGGIMPYSNIYYSDIWWIDLESLEWFKIEYSLTTGVYDHRMSVVDDYHLYSFGGYHDEGCLNSLERFPVQPPTLYRLCLEFISQSPILINHTESLPAAIVDELNLNDKKSCFNE